MPTSRMKAVRRVCQNCEMKGDGLKSILSKVGRALGPIAKEIGPTVMKELVLPMLKKKLTGSGLSVPGGSLKLAGQGRKRRRRRKKGGAMSTVYTN